MNNYDFLTLSPYEFEGLTRDLLQAHLEVFLESFGLGADNGIDLRYANGDQFIVQCKRYQDYESLYQTLRKEVDSVVKLAPKRYLLVTNVSLLPERKKRILELFAPYILSTDDILGKDDLNNLLQQHPLIERNHFKLWLSSTNILNTILNRGIVNQSSFILEDIKEKLKVYVQNDSFKEANLVLKDNRYVIISGIPGIGKTTLAEILVYDALANGYEEFVYLSDSIKEGFTMYEESRSQVFLFDDFLGSNFLENSLDTNEEKHIIRFIKKIQATKNKLLIFTTREYILNQAKLRFEEFEKTDLVKCILDLSKYTTMVKAQILYNHLFFKGIPYVYIQALISKNYLLEIIKHPNYSPRIIEYISKETLWAQHEIADFPEALLDMFNYPYKVWEHAFENQISSIAKLVLYALLITGAEVSLAHLSRQVKCLNGENQLTGLQGQAIFKKALKELENSFIHATRTRDGDTLIKFHNPSIQDFLVDFCNRDDGIKSELIRSFLFLKPALDIFSDKYARTKGEQRFELSIPLLEWLQARIIADFDELEYSTENYKYGAPSNDDKTCLKLSAIDARISYKEDSELAQFIVSTFEPLVYSEEIGNKGVHAYNQLLMNHFAENEELEVSRILLNISPALWREGDFSVLADFEHYFPEQYEEFREEYAIEFQEIFSGVLADLSSSCSENKEELQKKIDSLDELERYYGIDIYDERKSLERAISKIEEAESMDDDHYGYLGYHSGRSVPDYHAYGDYDKDLGSDKQSASFVRSYSEQEQVENLFRSMDQDS